MIFQKFWLFLIGAILLVSAVAGTLVFRGRTGDSSAGGVDGMTG